MVDTNKVSFDVEDSQFREDQLQHVRIASKIREAEIEAKYCNETFTQDQVDKCLAEIFASL